MRTIKFYSLLIMIGILFQGCNQNENDQLKKDNDRLRKELNELQDDLDNSIVIPQDEIDKYIYPIVVSASSGKVKKEFEISTFLVLGNLPENIKWKWNSTPEPMKLTIENLKHTVYAFYENPRKMSYRGNYVLTFPNNKKTTFRWLREFEIVD